MIALVKAVAHLFNQGRDPQSTIQLLQTIKVFQCRVQLGHQSTLIDAAAVTRVELSVTKQIFLGCSVHRPEYNRKEQQIYLQREQKVMF